MSRWLAPVVPFVLLFTAACSQGGSPGDRTDPGRAQIREPVGMERVTVAPRVDQDAVRAQLAEHRAQQIARLHAYAEASEFPHNFAIAPSTHMFRDESGRLCAVANLVHLDGRDDLVGEAARTRNDLAIADVHGGPMLDWVLASGLTQEELARVQLPLPPVQRSAKVLPQPDLVALTEAKMQAAVRAHIAGVEAELRAQTARSLDVAVERWITARSAGGARVATIERS